ASITNQSTKAVQELGKIYAPTAYGQIYGPVTFHERYLGQPTTCNLAAPSKVTFNNMTANNGTIKATAWSHYYMQSVANCTKYFWTKDTTTGYTNSLGA